MVTTATFTPPPWPQELIAIVNALQPFETKLVGGTVRALLANSYHATLDHDLCTTATPPQAMAKLAALGAKIIPTGIAHGTLTVIYQSFQVELTTLREDTSTNGRHAKVQFTTNWEADSARRDFTINAIYADLTGTLTDFQHGMADFHHHRLRFVGTPTTRVQEDSLRILRYLRFIAQLGWETDIDEALTQLTPTFPYMENLSAERITQELKKWAEGQFYRKTLPYLQTYPLLTPLKLTLTGNTPPASPYLPTCVQLAALFNGWEGLAFSNAEKHLIHQTSQAKTALQVEPPLAVATQYGQAATLAAMVLAGETAETCSTFATLPIPTFPLTGQDVLNCGLPPSPKVGNLLQQTQQWWRSHTFPPREACLAHLKTLI